MPSAHPGKRARAGLSGVVCSYRHSPTAPGIHSLFHSLDVACDIIPISLGRIDRNDLIDGDEVPFPNVERADEGVPVREPVNPTVHLGIAAQLSIKTGTVRETALIA